MLRLLTPTCKLFCINVYISAAISNQFFCLLKVKNNPQNGVPKRAFLFELGMMTNKRREALNNAGC
jgi:hypothetical protein